MMRFLSYLLLILTPSVLFGQELNAELSDDQMMIGQAVTLTYSVELELSDSMSFSPKVDMIEARATMDDASLSAEGVEFELRDVFVDTFIFETDGKNWIGQYVITAWDSGIYILPGQAIIINDSTYFFDDVEITCHLVDPVKNVDLYDIKEGFAELPPRPFSMKRFLEDNWWVLLIIVVLIGAFLFWKLRKKREPEVFVQRSESLKDRAIKKIEVLDDKKLWEHEQLKEHFVELSYILRTYLTERYKISLLEKTTYETTLLLTKKGLNEDTVKVIVRILSQADMVKFAKSKPETIAILRISTLAKQVVAETSPLEFGTIE
ncbi:MAG: hypothetical protein QNK23_06665 [Crocinitomicaceae bacterium]|nr:hypothetical protein [Crocinitomicaceae bacterium]